MATGSLGAPPLLSTPDTHLLNDLGPHVAPSKPQESDEEICERFEIQKTLTEIQKHSWRRIALQFPDDLLVDSTRVFRLLSQGLAHEGSDTPSTCRVKAEDAASHGSHSTSDQCVDQGENIVKLSILADTSYGSCCVDEIAAEHLDADAVVHYGRACLSSTARLPVIHVFTRQSLDCVKAVDSFIKSFPDKSAKIMLTADAPYAHHVASISRQVAESGYQSIFATEIIHDPASIVPNRTVPAEILKCPERSKEWRLFHISKPPTSLLLTLSSRLYEVRVYAIDSQHHDQKATRSILADTSLILRRRYALVTSLATVSIWGILINTLSVKNYLHIVSRVKSQIAAAGKKSYLFVVGKLNAAKVANFGEVGGWVVIGCWESSLVDSKDFYKPVITPFELDLALQRDEDRVWTGEWSADFQSILNKLIPSVCGQIPEKPLGDGDALSGGGNYDAEDESAPPDFDLRSGRYISQSRPMQTVPSRSLESSSGHGTSQPLALAKRADGAVVAVNGVASPAAQFLRSSRTWQGLGSDVNVGYEEEEEKALASTAVQEGRSGIARGYATATGSART